MGQRALSKFGGDTKLGGMAHGCADPWAPQQPGEMGWQEPHKLQQEVQGPAPLEQQLQAQEGAGGQPVGKQLGRNPSLASPYPAWGALESQ